MINGSDNIHVALEKLAEERRGNGMTSAGAVGLGLGGIAGLSGGATLAALAHHYSNKHNKP